MSDWKGQKWEYHVVTTPLHSPMQDEQLDAAGQWGWELAVVATEPAQTLGTAGRFIYTFKRPVPPPAKVEMP